MLSPHRLLLSLALPFLGGTIITPSALPALAAHTYRGAAVHADTGKAVVIARSSLSLPLLHEHEEDLSTKRTTEFALTLPRFDIGHGDGYGEEASLMKKTSLAKRDALDANAALFAPTAMVKVGGKEHKMLIVPSESSREAGMTSLHFAAAAQGFMLTPSLPLPTLSPHQATPKQSLRPRPTTRAAPRRHSKTL